MSRISEQQKTEQMSRVAQLLAKPLAYCSVFSYWSTISSCIPRCLIDIYFLLPHAMPSQRGCRERKSFIFTKLSLKMTKKRRSPLAVQTRALGESEGCTWRRKVFFILSICRYILDVKRSNAKLREVVKKSREPLHTTDDASKASPACTSRTSGSNPLIRV